MDRFKCGVLVTVLASYRKTLIDTGWSIFQVSGGSSQLGATTGNLVVLKVKLPQGERALICVRIEGNGQSSANQGLSIASQNCY